MSQSNYSKEKDAAGNDIVRLWSSLNVFKELSKEDLSELAKASKLSNYQKGDIIIKEGMRDYAVYFLLSGSVTVYKNQQTLAIIKEMGDVFAIDADHKSLAVVSNESTATISIDMSVVKRSGQVGQFNRKQLIFNYVSEIIAERLQNLYHAGHLRESQIESLEDQEGQTKQSLTKTSNVEKRKWPRYRISIPIAVNYRGRQINDVQVKNLSLGGVLCLLSEKLNVDEKVEISMNLPPPDENLNPIDIFFKARVIRVESNGVVGTRKYRETALQSINIENYFGSFLQAYLYLESSKGNAARL